MLGVGVPYSGCSASCWWPVGLLHPAVPDRSQLAGPDEFRAGVRGRVMSVYILVLLGGQAARRTGGRLADRPLRRPAERVPVRRPYRPGGPRLRRLAMARQSHLTLEMDLQHGHGRSRTSFGLEQARSRTPERALSLSKRQERVAVSGPSTGSGREVVGSARKIRARTGSAYRYMPPLPPGCGGCRLAQAARSGGQRPAHLLQLGPGGHLLGEQRGLDAVEQTLQPADQLGLGDPQLGVGRGGVLAERQGDPFQLLDQLRGQARPSAPGSRPGGWSAAAAGWRRRAARPSPRPAAAGSCCRSASPWRAAPPCRSPTGSPRPHVRTARLGRRPLDGHRVGGDHVDPAVVGRAREPGGMPSAVGCSVGHAKRPYGRRKSGGVGRPDFLELVGHARLPTGRPESHPPALIRATTQPKRSGGEFRVPGHPQRATLPVLDAGPAARRADRRLVWSAWSSGCPARSVRTWSARSSTRASCRRTSADGGPAGADPARHLAGRRGRRACCGHTLIVRALADRDVRLDEARHPQDDAAGPRAAAAGADRRGAERLRQRLRPVRWRHRGDDPGGRRPDRVSADRRLVLSTSVPLGLVVLVTAPLLVLAALPLLRPLDRRQEVERTRDSDLTGWPPTSWPDCGSCVGSVASTPSPATTPSSPSGPGGPAWTPASGRLPSTRPACCSPGCSWSS